MRVQGFKASAVKANIKYENRLDLGVILSDVSCVTGAVFTKNLVKAAPVLDAMELLKKTNSFRAIVVNSGNANACTGKQGIENCIKIREEAARLINCKIEEVLVCSTGVIGVQLPMSNYLNGLRAAFSSLSEDGLIDVSEAILTTDTRSKIAVREVHTSKTTINVFGMAKGAGMIAPKMESPHATMLAFILTDAVVEPTFWQELIENAAEKTFNRITVDGDMSTNDTVLAMANGFARNRIADGDSEISKELSNAVFQVMKSLAEQIVMDGEGATKCVNIIIKGARTEDDAEKCARAIANSALVKTAFYGEDPNWGRIIAACGYSGAEFDPSKVQISIGSHLIVKDGYGMGIEVEELAKQEMKKHRFSVEVDLRQGDFSFEILTCDFSTEYVHINADYRT